MPTTILSRERKKGEILAQKAFSFAIMTLIWGAGNDLSTKEGFATPRKRRLTKKIGEHGLRRSEFRVYAVWPYFLELHKRGTPKNLPLPPLVDFLFDGFVHFDQRRPFALETFAGQLLGGVDPQFGPHRKFGGRVI